MDFALKLGFLVAEATNGFYVSILVLMDFALKQKGYSIRQVSQLRFNPCFDGFCSKTKSILTNLCNLSLVSILVLMDFALKLRLHIRNAFAIPVSILVLMDFALKHNASLRKLTTFERFNPCFDGFCSKTRRLRGILRAKTLFQSLF